MWLRQHRLFGAEVPCIRPRDPDRLSSGRIAAAGLTQPSFELRHAGFGRFAGRGFAREACLCFLPRLPLPLPLPLVRLIFAARAA